MTPTEIIAREYWQAHNDDLEAMGFPGALVPWDAVTPAEQARIIARHNRSLQALTAAGLCIVPRDLILDHLTADAQAMGLYDLPGDEPRPMTGILPTMTPEQQEAAKAYSGSINMGDPSMVKAVTGETK